MYQQEKAKAEQNKTNEEVIPLAFIVAKQHGKHDHQATCATFISATVDREMTVSDAVNKAVEIATSKGVDSNKALEAAEISAVRYSPLYTYSTLPTSSGYDALDCASTPTSGMDKYIHALKCTCGMSLIPFVSVKNLAIIYQNDGMGTDLFIKLIMDYATYHDASDSSAVCAGFYTGEFLLGLWFTSTIEKVVESAEFACIDEEYARTEVENYAKARYPYFNP